MRMRLRNPFTIRARNRLVWYAFTRGASPLLALASLHRATLSRHRHVVMVTGSFGKTTTTRAVRAALGLPASAWAELNTNTRGEVAWTVLREPPWRRAAVIEAGAGVPGWMARYARAVRPDTVIVTGIGAEHLAAFGSLEALRDEKAEALRALAPSGTAILNADDPHVRWMATQTRARIRWFGLSAGVDVRASDVALDWPHGTRFTLHVAGTASPLRTRLVGGHFVPAILAAVAAGLAAGRPLAAMLPGLAALTPTRARLQPVVLANGAQVLCDEYKGTPQTLAPALAVLSAAPARRRLVVLGHLNNLPSAEDAPFYAAAGEQVASVADRVLVVGDRLADYRVGLRRAGFADAQLWAAPDVHAAIAHLRDWLRAGDVVLLKGFEDEGLSRIALALSGRTVRCTVARCELHEQFCEDCRLLERPTPAAPAVVAGSA